MGASYWGHRLLRSHIKQQTAQESNKQGEDSPLPLHLLPTMQPEQKVNYGAYAQECFHGYTVKRY